MSRRPALHLFEGYGIELEYILVESKSLGVLPVSDKVLRFKAGRYVNEIANNTAGWSNELALHVLEIKNNRPVPSLSGLGLMLQEQVIQINSIVEKWEGRLMPSGMHPWMQPSGQTRLWDHRNRKIYKTYDRIFGCSTHGWANIQSIHINLPFNGDEEFGRLHAAVRLLLPLIPALAASSPFVEGKATGLIDNRLAFYRKNQLLVPSISGDIIPEPVFTRSEYEGSILQKMYADIAGYDPEGILQHEWLNSRGAVPRFQRSAMEIRLADTQECPGADIAVANAIVSVLKALVSNRWTSHQDQAAWPVGPLLSILQKTISSGETAIIEDPAYLRALGYPEKQARAADIWRHLINECLAAEAASDNELIGPLRLILDRGTLAGRILKSAGENPSASRLHMVYEKLCDCLAQGRLFAE